MTDRTIAKRALAVAFALLAAALPLAEIAAAGPPEPAVPDRIEVPAGNKPFLSAYAVGVQVYECDGATWRFVEPRAHLLDDRGKLIATHFAGPTWQAKDGSMVVGQRVDGTSVDPTAIPWLLLSAAATSAGHDGERLAATTYIQRVDTTGGLAPATTCSESAAGVRVEVPYTADYVFWKATRKDHA